jgi:Cd2+/Zn2+-exporting ATPase
VERFARIYTPVVLLLALAVFLLPPLVAGASWSTWFYRALVLLVISCPCALVLSTPVSIVSALAAAARSGVLVKGGVYLEEAARLRGVAFDKTGTLTTGRVEVFLAEPAPGAERDDLLAVAASLERYSEHPIGEVIVAWCRGEGVEPLDVDDFQTVPGRGVRGSIDGKACLMGSSRFLREEGVDLSAAETCLEELAREGHTLAVAAREGVVLGCLALRDRPRAEAAGVVADLREEGIDHVLMLTGDNPRTAAAVGEEVGIDEVEANLLPEDKLATVTRHRRELGHFAMVGDGINDAPALAASSLGVAMGTAGSDAALETADAALMADDLTKMVYLVRLGRKAVRTIRFNIAFALLLKALFVVLALTGWATLWMAVGADMGASLLVIGNGLRLLGYRHAGAVSASG